MTTALNGSGAWQRAGIDPALVADLHHRVGEALTTAHVAHEEAGRGRFSPADERALEASATIFIIHCHGVEGEHFGRIEVNVRGKAALAVTVADDDAESCQPTIRREYSRNIVKLH